MQKAGNQEPWKLEELKAGLENFNTKHGHYPTAPEIDSDPYLPSARTIERKFGGIIGLRKALKLDTQTDMREGVHNNFTYHFTRKGLRACCAVVNSWLVLAHVHPLP